MSEELPTRRDVLKVAAAVGVAALAGAAEGQSSATAPAQSGAPTTKAAPIVGMQIGAAPLAGDAGTTDRLFDTLRVVGGINTLFLFAFAHEARFLVPMKLPNFRGGTYGIPHLEYYEDSNLAFSDLRAPEFGDIDVMDRTMKASRKHGFKTYAIIEESEGQPPSAPWQAMYEYDYTGRRQRDPCSNNPAYRAFNMGLAEDYVRSYDVDGIMWSSERMGPFTQAIGAKHGGTATDPTRSTCFCEFCVKKAAAQGIKVDRAKKGFAALAEFVRGGRAGKRPRDGYFVTLMRLLFSYPELLQWESLWINSRKELMIDIRKRVKAANPKTPVGFHVWHNCSFSPFYRAESDFGDMAKDADFIKTVLYNRIGGSRIATFVNSVGQTIFGDLPKADILQMVYKMFDYQEAPYDQVAAAGLSTDYITREVRRTLDDTAGSNVPIYAGLDIDIPGTDSPYTAQNVKEAVLASFRAGAQGIVFARNWGEMNPDHVAGSGAAVRELGFS